MSEGCNHMASAEKLLLAQCSNLMHKKKNTHVQNALLFIQKKLLWCNEALRPS